MALRVFGPRVTGYGHFGVHIGVTTEVFRATAAGKTVPTSLSVVLSPPIGESSTITSVANGQSTTVAITPGISVSATIENCRTQPASGTTPEMFAFQVVLHAAGSVRVGPISLPVSAQIDAFDVFVPVDAAVHAQIVAAATAPSA